MKKYIICLLVLLSNVLIAQNKNALVFEESIYSVEIQIENGKDYLELDKENKIQIVTKNIDPVNMSFSGQNLKRDKLSNDKKVTNLTLTINRDALKDNKYSLFITFRGKKGKLFQHEFLISVK